MKWIRKKPYKNNIEKYHLDYHGEPIQETHYLTTRCKKEIKGLYHNWDIREDPPAEECCKECLAIIESEGK